MSVYASAAADVILAAGFFWLSLRLWKLERRKTSHRTITVTVDTSRAVRELEKLRDHMRRVEGATP